jgi:hypothetical protein
MTNFERINSEKFQQLSRQDLNEIRGGWKLFGKDKKYDNQTMGSVGASGRASTGWVGETYFFGIQTSSGWHETDQVDD